MAAAGRVRSEDQFLCSICLDVFTDPVTIPCGHNFCKSCISEHWRVNVPYQCPMCKEVFNLKPQLKINTIIKEMVAQFRHEAQHEPNISSSDQQAAKPGEVPCDVCTEPKLKALKSCLVCLTSYCRTHVDPHLTVPALKRHQLIHPVENLEDRMCRKHDKPLEVFCKTDHTCICHHCAYSDHKGHDVTPLKDEHEEQKPKLKKTEAEIKQMIQERRLKIQEIQRSVELSKNAADRETAEGVEVYTALMKSVQRGLDQLLEKIQEKQRSTEKQAEDFIKELEQEICELEKRSTEVKQLSGSEDHLHFVQRFTCVKAAPSMKTWTKVSVRPPSYEGTVERAVSELEKKLREDMKKKKMKKKVVKAELKRVQQYEVDLTLDPDTAHSDLILSDDGKHVHHGDKKKNLPDKPQRFSHCPSILAKQSFSSGRFYFEVQVKGKTKWDLGVVRESVNRKGQITCSPLYGYWTIRLRNGNEYEALADPRVRLSVQPGLQKVGVFVDYEEGLVSFYDVGSSVLIYSFIGCCFNDKLLPYFSPCLNDGGTNSAPLIITPVRH
ncbi:E3 ubiquitin-protein ligase TRIM39-like [Sphaeramia orbicularis]|uniref:E3 ubiquitin-protein ligase TRIM39-like n=1 Tax=Sphaeramia orbicularis TaxID=375764 RepID=A0A673A7Q3_9TELE|nr:E3 ubiquitin-protein ligase TRIM39-like [Sphaeramia orbicularis]XP_030015938.1 E3 ubiquitin-protein ligase TRIM39-like [Sphaeramia orbicularis]